ncbi:hypothetical protein [Sphingosinicella sp. BN140058]|uniref:hypothetical protein n=1 Tax=Sphingosinicella sp. BN140058 TaxID=1892855 RepID=UPI0010107EC3|nr:hypothetical protein [Sphingosinicella sp. BN140058]QAY77560.1 hypothetical protein ETR14_14370 [Sphingosinicella sp. BN140058]
MKTLFAAVALAIAIPAAAQAQTAPADPHAGHAGHSQHAQHAEQGKAKDAHADHKAQHDSCLKAGKSAAECEKMCAEHGMKHDGPHAGHGAPSPQG